MYIDGLRIRSKVPKLPEAKNPEGSVIVQGKGAYHILILGESTVAGVGVATHQEGYAGVLAARLSEQLNTSIHWKVYAKSGYTTRQVISRILPTLPLEQFDLIVVGLGGNDAFTLNTPWAWQAHLNELISKLKGQYPNTPIYFTNMPPIKEFIAFTPLIKLTIGNLVELLGQVLTSIARKRKQVFYNSDIISLKTWTRRFNLENPVDEFFSDGVHPSKLTYQTWAIDSAHYITKHAIIRKAE